MPSGTYLAALDWSGRWREGRGEKGAAKGVVATTPTRLHLTHNPRRGVGWDGVLEPKLSSPNFPPEEPGQSRRAQLQRGWGRRTKAALAIYSPAQALHRFKPVAGSSLVDSPVAATHRFQPGGGPSPFIARWEALTVYSPVGASQFKAMWRALHRFQPVVGSSPF